MNTRPEGLREGRAIFARIAHENEAALLRASRRLCPGDDDRAMDLAQETLVRAYQAYVEGRFQDNSNARAWLIRIMTNIFINDYRRRQKWEANVDFETLAVSGAASPVELQASPDDVPGVRLLKQTLDHDLERALGMLSDILRACVVLVDIEGLEYAEAAEALGVPVGTVRSRLARARMQLHDLLQDYARRRGLLPARAKGGGAL
ncbi:MAG TPA: sigma-70 family RNA polymerase sigma factor [Capsulimonadaceae bacterium]|nr:sigma-70 family RNA polymerase sigma factor [Capsulimonadaceae bacterium]